MKTIKSLAMVNGYKCTVSFEGENKEVQSDIREIIDDIVMTGEYILPSKPTDKNLKVLKNIIFSQDIPYYSMYEVAKINLC